MDLEPLDLFLFLFYFHVWGDFNVVGRSDLEKSWLCVFC